MSAIETQIDNLSELKAGWHSGEGKLIDLQAIKTAKYFVNALDKPLEKALITPTIEGGVLIEFIENGYDFGLEFKSDNTAIFYGVEINGHEEFHDEISISQKDYLLKRVNAARVS